MIDPTDPMPPTVYVRRRMIAIAVSAVSVVVLAWIIARLVGSADEDPLPSASARVSHPPSSRPPAASASSSSAAPSSSVVRAASLAAPPTSPAPPGPCPDAAMRVAAETGAPGQRPLLRLVIVNAGQLACTRDVGRSLRELVVTSADGSTRLWSSNDCYAPPGEDRRLLQPGERLDFTVTWAGRTSEPGCPTQRRTLPAGTYLLTPKLGAIAGKPVPLELVR